MSELFDKRKLFTELIPKLLSNMESDNKIPLFGPDGKKHMPNSLHYLGLAMDIDLFDSSGKYLDRTEDHAKYGAYWKSLHVDCRWGGDFKIHDGNHYSIHYHGES